MKTTTQKTDREREVEANRLAVLLQWASAGNPRIVNDKGILTVSYKGAR